MERSYANLYTLKADKATTLSGYGITDAVNTTGDQTIAGNKIFSNLVNSSAGFKYTGVTSTGTFLVQDGTGRSNWYWGTNGGLSPTFITAGESAGNVKLHPADAANIFVVNYADGTGKNAGDALAWTTLFNLGPTDIQYKGQSIIHSGNISSQSVANATNATNATKLVTARTISIAGDATGSASFDGSANASITATLANSGVTAGTYKSVTVDAKGRVTAGSSPTTVSGYGITDAYTKTEVDAKIKTDVKTLALANPAADAISIPVYFDSARTLSKVVWVSAKQTDSTNPPTSSTYLSAPTAAVTVKIYMNNAGTITELCTNSLTAATTTQTLSATIPAGAFVFLKIVGAVNGIINLSCGMVLA